jgi:hypothetical protein
MDESDYRRQVSKQLLPMHTFRSGLEGARFKGHVFDSTILWGLTTIESEEEGDFKIGDAEVLWP